MTTDSPKAESNVVGIVAGQPIATPGKPDRQVIEACERLLDQARSGEICGLVYVEDHSDASVSSGTAGSLHTSTIIGECFRLMSRLS